MGHVRYFALAAAALGGCMLAAPAHATLIADGVSYTLKETILTATTAQFDLSITGINGTSDAEKGRYGVQSFALTPPGHLSGEVAPSGFAYQTGGLAANGCNGSGNFICFSANTTPIGPVLAANSSLDFVFSLTISSGVWASYDPSFKINWEGTKNNYDLVSKTLTPINPPAPTPEPGSLAIIAGGLFGLGCVLRRRKSRVAYEG
jgi:hypothetical protein